MVLNIGAALAAYKNNSNAAENVGSVADAGGSGASFSDTLKGFANDTVKSLEAGEKASIDGATGKQSIVNVVTAVNDATLMLQTVVTIRDKVIAAYQSITQTAI